MEHPEKGKRAAPTGHRGAVEPGITGDLRVQRRFGVARSEAAREPDTLI